MRHDPARQQLFVRVLYFGAPGCGKSTVLWHLRRSIASGRLTEMTARTAASIGERDPSFIYPATELGPVLGNQLQVEVVTYAGSAATLDERMEHLRHADGIVLLLDGRPQALEANRRAVAELHAALAQRSGEPPAIVVQVTKQDLTDHLAPDALLRAVAPEARWPALGSSAPQGTGMAEVLFLLLGLLRERAQRLGLPAEDDFPASWLVECWNCRNMVDLDAAAMHQVRPCPVCGSPMEILDADHGKTREPAAAPAAPPLRAFRTPLPATALTPQDWTPAGGQRITTTPGVEPPYGPAHQRGMAPGPGFTVVEDLDASLLGRRQRLRDDASGRTFRALTCSAGLVARPGFREGLARRLDALSGEGHEHLVMPIEIRATPVGPVVLSTDTPDHQTLSRVLARERTLEPHAALTLLRQVALGLDEGARRGLVHGWLRPEAILVDRSGHVMVDDLAVPPLPRALLEVESASDETEHWVAPECLESESPPSLRTTSFLLGSLLLRLVTGRAQVTGRSPRSALQRVLASGPLLLREAKPGVPVALAALHERLVTCGISGSGFLNTAAILEAIDGCLNGRPAGTGTFRRPTTGRTTTTMVARQPGTATHRATGTGPQRRTQPITGPIRRPLEGSPLAPTAPKPSGPPVGLLVAGAVGLVVLVGIGALALGSSRPTPAPAEATEDPPANPPPLTQAEPAAAPAAPAPVSATTTAAPAPTKSLRTASIPAAPTADLPARAPAKPLAQRDQLDRIATLMLAERFGDAMSAVESLPDEELRKNQRERIVATYTERQQEILALVERGASLAAVNQALVPAKTLWAMPGVEDWVASVLAQCRDKQAEAPLVTVTAAGTIPATGTTPAVSAAGTTPAVGAAGTTAAVGAAGSTAAITIPVPPPVEPDAGLTALAAAIRSAALAESKPTVPSAPEATAVQRLLVLWQGRSALLARLVGQQGSRLRIPHPTSGDAWDVVSVTADHLHIASPSGASGDVPWSQIPLTSSARLLSQAVTLPAATPGDHAIAAAAHLLADAPILAQVEMKPARTTIPPEVTRDLETVITLAQRRQVVLALTRGLEAAKGGNPRAMTEALTDLRRFEPAQLLGREDIVSYLEHQSRPTSAAPAAAPAAAALPGLKESQEGLRLLGWEPTGEARLDGTEVVLPANAAITATVPADSMGYTVSLSGAPGFMKILFSRRGSTASTGLMVAVPADRTSFTIRLSRDEAQLLDRNGRKVDHVALPGPTTQITLRATAEVRFSPPPKAIIELR